MTTTTDLRLAEVETQLASALARLKRLEQYSSQGSYGPSPFRVKPPFRDKFSPGEGSIASFLYVYESAMEGATDLQKTLGILPCLSSMAQEIMVPNMASLTTWAKVKQALIDEFGSKSSLQRIKQAFMRLCLQEGETLPTFIERFYSQAQPLLLAKLLPLDDAITAIMASLAPYSSLAMHITAVKSSLKSVRDIKEALLEVADFYKPELLLQAPMWEETWTLSASYKAVPYGTPPLLSCHANILLNCVRIGGQ